MPIYEYVCSNCKLKFELLKAMSQSDEGATCPSCGRSAKRVLSLFSKSSDGSPSSSGGNSCSTCASDSCSSCSL
ncbi:MAG TPA: zinc ribbon domain-containing protein [Dehalococcoidia bacterium]|nr:zinc ribbon domain-containing protein [Dehalococcoidia bacterium]